MTNALSPQAMMANLSRHALNFLLEKLHFAVQRSRLPGLAVQLFPACCQLTLRNVASELTGQLYCKVTPPSNH